MTSGPAVVILLWFTADLGETRLIYSASARRGRWASRPGECAPYRYCGQVGAFWGYLPSPLSLSPFLLVQSPPPLRPLISPCCRRLLPLSLVPLSSSPLSGSKASPLASAGDKHIREDPVARRGGAMDPTRSR